WIKALTAAPIRLPNRLTMLTSRFKVCVIPPASILAYSRCPGCFMPRHALVSMLAMGLVMGLASLPAETLADDIKPKAPETAFSGKLRPDILGISSESSAQSTRAILDSLFKGRTDTKTDIQQQKFGGASYVAALNFSLSAD